MILEKFIITIYMKIRRNYAAASADLICVDALSPLRKEQRESALRQRRMRNLFQM